MIYRNFQKSLEETGEIGFVEEVVHSIAQISGLPGARPNEVILFEQGGFGQVITLREDKVEALIFSEDKLSSGAKATRTNQTIEIPVGDALLGLAIDPLGQPLDAEKPIIGQLEVRSIETESPDVSKRHRIHKPMNTGVVVVDTMLPIGRGQRQLVIGDRKTGKSYFLLRTILNQAKEGTVCIYAGIGKKRLDIKKIEEYFQNHEISKNTIIVASSPHDPSGIIFLTPYTAMTIAEYFRDKGRDVLLILDDLSTHAKFYREISLLGRRFPGRNSYPGDMFFTHAKLLERAGNFSKNGEEPNAITCLPVVETMQGDLSGYIQTNIMSMTDGHVYFDSDLFSKGRRPAINPFLSVTRVGHQTQSPLRREINREISSFLSLYEKMQTFVHFGAELNANIKNILSRGEKIMAFFNQSTGVLPLNVQLYLFSLLWLGQWDNADEEQMEQGMDTLCQKYEEDSIFKKKVDNMMVKHNTFNDLLNEVRRDLVQAPPPVVTPPQPQTTEVPQSTVNPNQQGDSQVPQKPENNKQQENVQEAPSAKGTIENRVGKTQNDVQAENKEEPKGKQE